MSGDGIYVRISGHDIYEGLWMPSVPRKGDILWLSSLTRGASKVAEATVSKVEWAMDQQSGTVHVWLTVRRVATKETGTRTPLPTTPDPGRNR